jgi:NADPH:quinone reductase
MPRIAHNGGNAMKAVQFDHFGEPASVLTVQERPIPEPGEGEARVRILASPVNPSDLLYVRGHYSGVAAHFPAPVGFEGVGVVDALGPHAEHPTLGQPAVIVNSDGGNWAEYAVVPVRDLIPAPSGIPDEQVASFLINPASAILMVRHVLAVPHGEWLLQSAAGSELGRMIIRLGRRDGFRTVNVVRRHDSVTELERLGADAVIVSADGPIDEQVRHMMQDVADLVRAGVLETSIGRKYPLDQINVAVAQAESAGRQGKVFLIPPSGAIRD